MSEENDLIMLDFWRDQFDRYYNKRDDDYLIRDAIAKIKTIRYYLKSEAGEYYRNEFEDLIMDFNFLIEDKKHRLPPPPP